VKLYQEPTEEEPTEHASVEQPAILRLQREPEGESADLRPRFTDFELPALTLLEDAEPFPIEEHDQRLREQATHLEKTFKDFDLNVKVVGINTGPVITQYEITLETGMRVHKVTGLGDDLALHLRVPSVRIVAPIPGKNTVGIEVPNEKRAVVRMKELIVQGGKKISKSRLPLFLGKDTEGRPLLFDLAEMPHLLIAGTTGTGKSVCLNAIISSILMTRRPDEVKMILIDPKMTEMTEYGKIPHLMHPVVTDMKKAEAILAWAVDKMEERYDLLSRARVRHISAYNELGFDELRKRLQPQDGDETKALMQKMPYIVIVVDELADLMMMMKREVETHIIRLAQKSRAAGIHLVVATQKPTVDVITGLIKSNLPGRICFKVSSRSDSRVVLDEMGADKLLGKGDMLFLQPGTSVLIRAQGAFVSDSEIAKIVQHLETDEPCFEKELVQLKPSGECSDGASERIKSRDDLYEQAVDIVVREGRGSVSLLQRSLGIGYGRAARLIDFMAEDGIVGAYNGSNAREVLVMPDQWQQMKSGAV
jgi:S-DNA-T family DNA segregation ATPase FtsK/SpoIIIE